jgi:RNA polymerase sigma-70 factor (ECF subfamily)
VIGDFSHQVAPLLPQLRGLARRLCSHDQAAADDVLQDTLLKAYLKQDQFDGRDLGAWLRRILRNTALNHYAQKHTRRRKEDLAFDDEPAPLAPEGLRIDLDTALWLLPPDFALAVRMAVGENASYVDIAQETGVPIGTVMSRINRARGRMQETLSE